MFLLIRFSIVTVLAAGRRFQTGVFEIAAIAPGSDDRLVHLADQMRHLLGLCVEVVEAYAAPLVD